jgi:hypothetical protein
LAEDEGGCSAVVRRRTAWRRWRGRGEEGKTAEEVEAVWGKPTFVGYVGETKQVDVMAYKDVRHGFYWSARFRDRRVVSVDYDWQRRIGVKWGQERGGVRGGKIEELG